MNLSFEWDEDKALLNFHKHGVKFEEAMASFEDENSITLNDLKHSSEEKRFFMIGLYRDKKLLAIVHTLRKDKIRIISARTANKKERRIYEKS
jgi:uncharacterized DUF497 family protein